MIHSHIRFFISLILVLVFSRGVFSQTFVDPNNSTALDNLKLPEDCENLCIPVFTDYLSPTCQSDPQCKCSIDRLNQYADCSECLIEQTPVIMNSEGRQFAAVSGLQATLDEFTRQCKDDHNLTVKVRKASVGKASSTGPATVLTLFSVGIAIYMAITGVL